MFVLRSGQPYPDSDPDDDDDESDEESDKEDSDAGSDVDSQSSSRRKRRRTDSVRHANPRLMNSPMSRELYASDRLEWD